MGQAELENIFIELPNGSGGSLWDLYNSINSGETSVSDDGLILSDDTLVPTIGQPYLGVTPEDLVLLMEAYIVDADGGRETDTPPEEGVQENKLSNSSILKLGVMGLLIYYIVK